MADEDHDERCLKVLRTVRALAGEALAADDGGLRRIRLKSQTLLSAFPVTVEAPVLALGEALSCGDAARRGQKLRDVLSVADDLIPAFEASGDSSAAAAPDKPSPTPKHTDAPPPAPDDLVTTAVAVKEFNVSRTTILRNIQSGRLRTYRAPGAARNAVHRLSRGELSSIFLKRG